MPFDKDVYYFPHDANAHADPKVMKAVMSHGWEAYGIYWVLIEKLRTEAEYTMPLDIESVAWSIRANSEVVGFLINQSGLFENDEKNFWSPSLLRRMSRVKNRSDLARKAAKKRWGKTDSCIQAHSDSNASGEQVQSVGNAIKEKERKEKKSDLFDLGLKKNKTFNDEIQADKTSKVGIDSYDRIYPPYQGQANTQSQKVAEIITNLFDEWPQEDVEYSVKNWMYTHGDLTLEEWGKIAQEARNVTKHRERDQQIIKNINAKINTWKINRSDKKRNAAVQPPPCPGYNRHGYWVPPDTTWWWNDARNATDNLNMELHLNPKGHSPECIEKWRAEIAAHEAAGFPWKIEVEE